MAKPKGVPPKKNNKGGGSSPSLNPGRKVTPQGPRTASGKKQSK